MIRKLWEVYGTHGECIGFPTEEAAKSQTIIDEVDFISEAKVDLTEKGLEELEANGYVWFD